MNEHLRRDIIRGQEACIRQEVLTALEALSYAASLAAHLNHTARQKRLLKLHTRLLKDEKML